MSSADLRAAGAGLVSFETSVQAPGSIELKLDKATAAYRRVSRLKRCVWAAGSWLSLPRKGHRPDVPWFVTLTYADPDGWKGRHISDALLRYRRFCARKGFTCRYTWVCEIQPGRALESGDEVPHYHLIVWLPEGVRMPMWDKQQRGRRAFWPHGCTHRDISTAGVGYLMKYLSKLGKFTNFPKGLRLYGVGGLDEQGKCIPRWLSLPEWAKAKHGVGDLVRGAFGLVVRATGEILESPYVVSILPGRLVLRVVGDVPQPFHDGPYSSIVARS